MTYTVPALCYSTYCSLWLTENSTESTDGSSILSDELDMTLPWLNA